MPFDLSALSSLFGDLPLGFVLFFLVLAVFLVLVVVVLVRELGRRNDLRVRGKRVVATVAHIRVHEDLMSSDKLARVYVTTASTTDPQTGQQHTFTDRRRRRPRFHEGETILVLVDPANPANYAFAD